MGTSTSPAQPEKIGPETRVRWYIENTGSPRLGEELSKLRDGGAECFEHRDMKCLDRQGKPIERNLYEVKKETAEHLMKNSRPLNVFFVLYRQVGDDPPRDYYMVVKSLRYEGRDDPFKAAERNRNLTTMAKRRIAARKKRPALKKLPAGVVKGGQMLLGGGKIGG